MPSSAATVVGSYLQLSNSFIQPSCTEHVSKHGIVCTRIGFIYLKMSVLNCEELARLGLGSPLLDPRPCVVRFNFELTWWTIEWHCSRLITVAREPFSCPRGWRAGGNEGGPWMHYSRLNVVREISKREYVIFLAVGSLTNKPQKQRHCHVLPNGRSENNGFYCGLLDTKEKVSL